ncbi:MAG: hypothetical protein H6936_08325 [Burkholderiales bacterium]|nr:hypothetical protein [Burkholderiales bacterium]
MTSGFLARTMWIRLIATELLNGRLISILNAYKTLAAIDVLDVIILWECD